MGRCGQVVMGPAGSGKSSYCARLAEHMQALQRSVHVVNLDPAADHFNYDVRARARSIRASKPLPRFVSQALSRACCRWPLT